MIYLILGINFRERRIKLLQKVHMEDEALEFGEHIYDSLPVDKIYEKVDQNLENCCMIIRCLIKKNRIKDCIKFLIFLTDNIIAPINIKSCQDGRVNTIILAEMFSVLSVILDAFENSEGSLHSMLEKRFKNFYQMMYKKIDEVVPFEVFEEKGHNIDDSWGKGVYTNGAACLAGMFVLRELALKYNKLSSEDNRITIPKLGYSTIEKKGLISDEYEWHEYSEKYERIHRKKFVFDIK